MTLARPDDEPTLVDLLDRLLAGGVMVVHTLMDGDDG